LSLYIVDASVAAKWFIEEPFAEAALKLAAGSHQLHVPDFFRLEMDSLFCKWIRHGLITEADASNLRSVLRQIPLRQHPFESLQDSAFAIANQTRRSIYDCLYLALAVSLGGRMVTADRRFYRGLAPGPLSNHIAWIGELT